jgi:hypothetical protein
MRPFWTQLPQSDRMCRAAAVWLIGLLAAGFAALWLVLGPADSRPRSATSRAQQAGQAVAAKRHKRQEAKPEPEPAPIQTPPEEIPPPPEKREARPPAEWPRSAVPLGPEPPPDVWPQSQIKDALAQCNQMLPDLHFDYKALPPIRKGACGTPAPIQLKYINDVPRVEIRPAATMSCPLADALDRWLDEVVQPRAKALLDATVIRLVNLAAYDCRPRYNNPSERMSYHAFAEAIDIAEFVTAKGEHINVLEHWKAGDERAQFLRDVHDGACKIFGTVLGPEANESHKNHFHVDMAKRRHSAFCQ